MRQTIRIYVLYANNKSTDQSAHVQILNSPITTVKSVLSGHSKIDKTKILMTNGGSMEHSAILLTCIKQKLVLKTNFGLLF